MECIRHPDLPLSGRSYRKIGYAEPIIYAVPFTLHPHVRAMLIDIGYADEAFFNGIGQIDQTDPWSAAHMDRFGITGYALRRSSDSWPIVHWPQLKTEALQKNGWCRENREYDEPWMQSDGVFQHPYVRVRPEAARSGLCLPGELH